VCIGGLHQGPHNAAEIQKVFRQLSTSDAPDDVANACSCNTAGHIMKGNLEDSFAKAVDMINGYTKVRRTSKVMEIEHCFFCRPKHVNSEGSQQLTAIEYVTNSMLIKYPLNFLLMIL
jgi:hypothetical protein